MSLQSVRQSAVTSPVALRQQRLDVQLRQLEFHALLHRKLDLERLFECLLTEGQAFVPFDGIHFLAGQTGIDIQLGYTRQHQQRFELRLGERLLGELVLMRARKFSSREERDAERLASSLIYPLDNALKHFAVNLQAMTDSATGLRNQRALDEQLNREIRLVSRAEQTLSMMLVSVDKTDSIAEEHGLEVAQKAWLSIAETLRKRLRQSDLIFKTDTDAFCIILSQTPLDGALVLADRLLAEIDRCIRYDNVQLVLTANIGISELGMSDDAAVLLQRTYDALRLARESGPKQIKAVYPEDPLDDNDPSAA